MTTGKRVRKSAEERKFEIVTAALKLADKSGPDRVTTETLADAVGLTHAGLFRHFPRKISIWEAVAEYIGEQMEIRWARAERTNSDAPDTRLRELLLSQLRLIRTFPAIPALLFSRELQIENEQLRKDFGVLMKRFHERLKNSIQDAQAEKIFRADLSADDTAYLLISLIQGLTVRWSVSAHRFSLLKEGERLIDLQLHSLRLPRK
ncbi:MAG: TetR family transcriptional regulator C-terminal domain-containing protein [Granulosicoccus sp.]